MERVYYYGNFARSWDTESYIARALRRLGHEVLEVDQNRVDLIPSKVERYGATMFLCSMPQARHLIAMQSIRMSGVPVVCWHFDLLNPDYSVSRFAWASSVARCCSLFVTTDGSTAPLLAAQGGVNRVAVVRQGVPDDTRQGRFREAYACDIAHVGGLYRRRTSWWLAINDSLGRRYRVRAFTNVRGGDLSDLALSAKLVVAPEYPSRPGYWSNRIYVLTGNGCCVLAPMIDGMEREGWSHGHFFGYRGIASLIDEADRLLSPDQDVARSLRAATGKVFAHQNFTYDHRVRQLLEHVHALRDNP